MSRLPGLVRPLAFGFVGAVFGITIGILLGLPTRQVTNRVLPYPHLVPKSAGGVSLRFAMVHDVIHERLPRHGAAFYKERNRRTRLALDELKATSPPDRPSQRAFDLTNDLAVGLEMAGDHEAAIQLMREKLKLQLALDLHRSELYSTHANLGTFLILGPFRTVRPGNEKDKAILREGLKCIQTAIDINPESHFGREVWQAAIIEYMIALYDQPDLLLTVDMVGNQMNDRLSDGGYSPLTDFKVTKSGAGHHLKRWGSNYGGIKLAEVAAEYVRHPDAWEKTKHARDGITRLDLSKARRVADEPKKESNPDVVPPMPSVPFDEPVLGIVGMWRLGGGAHPYFAVALGETMLRVGQNYIAWTAFERAARLANFAWPDPKLQQQFTTHCRARQSAIEAKLSPDEVSRLRPSFDVELAFGQDYQRAYQQYEEERITAGASIEDPHFYSVFDAQRGPIASPLGHADWFHIDSGEPVPTGISVVGLSLLLAGIFALLGAASRSR